MQTTGAALLTVRRCSPVRMRMLAQDSRSAYGLLYFAAAAMLAERRCQVDRWLTVKASLTARPPFRPEARLAQGGRWHKFTRFG